MKSRSCRQRVWKASARRHNEHVKGECRRAFSFQVSTKVGIAHCGWNSRKPAHARSGAVLAYSNGKSGCRQRGDDVGEAATGRLSGVRTSIAANVRSHSQRMRAPDPELPLEIAPPQRLLRRCNRHSTNQAGRRAIGAFTASRSPPPCHC
jgi:hypothetical protein